VSSEIYPDLARFWYRHERSRMAGVPTISLLIGDAELLASVCEDALGASERTIAWSSAADRLAIASDWWNEIVARRELTGEAIALIAAGADQSLRELRSARTTRTTSERLHWLEHCDAPELADVLPALRATLTPHTELNDVDARLRSLMTWLPRPEPLGLIVNAANMAGLHAALTLAIDAPRLPILASVDRDAWSRLKPQLDQRSLSLLEQGMITLTGKLPIACGG
jgi:hypothetical protein